MAPLDKLKKKNQPQISVALLRMKPMSHDAAQMDAMSNDHGNTNMEDSKKPADNASNDTSEDTTEGGAHPANTEPAPSDSLASELQDLLNNVSAYYITAHQFHWNVVGPDFAEFHEFFEEIYTDAWNSLDGLAESIRKMDQMVDIEFGEPDECEGVREMLGCLSDMNKALIEQYKDTIDCADKYREQGILNFLADRLDKHQMFQWQISSFTKSA
jgi:starvation-inducible DNA-binding protein